MTDPEVRSKRPGWYRITWFLGRPPELSDRQWKVLGLVAIVSLFEQYDLYLFSLNLKQIQTDLAISEGSLGWLGSLVRAGALLAIPLTLAADRLGRRRLLLATVVGYTLLTGATAFAPSTTSFVALQFLARAFAVAETLIAVVVIAEEFPPAHRGWGIGALGAIQACGAGLAAIAFGFVDVLPHGWRDLYLVGLGPLVAVAYWRRTLPETQRFAALQREQGESLRAAPTWEPMRRLLVGHPRRILALLAVVALAGVAFAPAGFFAPKYLQDVHGWTPGSVALLNLFGGMFAIIGNPLAGWLSDRFGRRPIASLFSSGFTVATLAFYGLAGFIAPAFWVLLIFTMMGSEVTLSAFGTEMFPTAQRTTASGLRSGVRELGGVAGLGLVSVLFGVLGSNWLAISALALAALGIPLIVWLAFPETARRSLEEISASEPLDRPVPAPESV